MAALVRPGAPRATPPKLLTHLAPCRPIRGRMPQALDLYRQGIAAADRAGDREMYAIAWNDLGYEYLEHGQLPHAEHALLEAYRVRKLNHLRSIESSYRNLGMLRLEQGDLRAAAGSAGSGRGSLRTAGRPAATGKSIMRAAACACSRTASKMPWTISASRPVWRAYWRREAFPRRCHAGEHGEQDPAGTFRAGGSRKQAVFRNPPPRRWPQETFESARGQPGRQLARASGRAARLAPQTARRILGDAAEARIRRGGFAAISGYAYRAGGRAGSPTAGRADRVGIARRIEYRRRNCPIFSNIRAAALRPDAAFFAFHLASPESYLWAVSRESFALYRLPPGPEIGCAGGRLSPKPFAREVPRRPGRLPDFSAYYLAKWSRHSAISRAGCWRWMRNCSNCLSPRWSRSAGAHGPVFLAERHSLQIISGAATAYRPPAATRASSRSVRRRGRPGLQHGRSAVERRRPAPPLSGSLCRAARARPAAAICIWRVWPAARGRRPMRRRLERLASTGIARRRIRLPRSGCRRARGHPAVLHFCHPASSSIQRGFQLGQAAAIRSASC